jgi:hypothetical protein
MAVRSERWKQEQGGVPSTLAERAVHSWIIETGKYESFSV